MEGVREAVRSALGEAFASHVEESPHGPTFLVPGGPYGVRVTVSRIDGTDSVVDVYTWVGRGVEVTPAVARYLLEQNARFRFAAVALDADGDIRIEASVFPDQVSAEALARLVDIVGAAAGEVEQELSGGHAG